MNVYIIRTRHLDDPKKLYWIVYSKEHKLTGRIGESKNSLLKRFQEKYGKITELTRYKGILRQAEMAMTVATDMMED